jgi:hypothetical protein
METLLLKADKIILDTAWMTIFKAYTSSGLDFGLRSNDFRYECFFNFDYDLVNSESSTGIKWPLK